MKRLMLGTPVISALILVAGIHWCAQAQMGGMGGAGMPGGGGGMPGGESRWPQRDKVLSELAEKPVQWKRPEGETPNWLINGKMALDAQEQLRDRLNRKVSDEGMKFVESPLRDVLSYLSDKYDIEFDIDHNRLSDESINVDDLVVSLDASKGTLREILRRILEVHHMTYIVRENYAEVTGKQSARERPTMRYYELGYVQPDSRNVNSLIEAIEATIEPETWQSNGGQGSIFVIGSLLVVSTTEWAHLEIEKLLYRLTGPAQSVSTPVIRS